METLTTQQLLIALDICINVLKQTHSVISLTRQFYEEAVDRM